MTLYLGNTPIAGTPSNMVTTDTAQTISGEKTFSDDVWTEKRYIATSNTTKGTPPADTQYAALHYVDNSGETTTAHRYGNVEFKLGYDGKNTSFLRAYKNEEGSTVSGSISVAVASDGTITTEAPAVTNNKGIVTQVGLSKSENGYLKLGNGVIIQWGTSENISERGSLTVTLPTAFTSTNYSVTANLKAQHTAANAEGVINVDDFTTTTFRLSAGYLDPNSAPVCWLAIGY